MDATRAPNLEILCYYNFLIATQAMKNNGIIFNLKQILFEKETRVIFRSIWDWVV